MRRHSLPLFSLLLALFSLLLWAGCSRNASGPLARVYHTGTSFFNGYYNAKRLMASVTLAIEDKYQIPDAGYIRVHYYGTEAEVKAVDGDLGKVIEKNDILIYKHFNGSFEDDCRILTGEAWFYRQNYSLALQNFNYLLDNFPRSPHAPHAKLWIARTYLAMGNKEGARSSLEEELLSQRDLILDDGMRAEIAIFQSQLLIEEGKLRKATDELEKGIPYIKRRREKAKAHFLLGQLYAARDSFARAQAEFDFVAKKSDRYDLAFKARLLSARMTVFGQQGLSQQDATAQMERILRKMLKDEKNNEYRDQIYYELALISLGKPLVPEALTLLNASIKANEKNQRQKALSYYKAGQIYFDIYRNFPKAEAYYDSAATVINKDAPEYEEITRINAVLQDYVKCVTTIEREDSLQRLARMPKEQLDALIDQIIADEQQKKEAAEKAANAQIAALASSAATTTQTTTSGGWYFDDPGLIASGKTQFMQQWGARKDEDHWRRSKKSLNMNTLDNVPAAPVDSALTKQFGDKAKYYQPIPFTPEATATSNAAIEQAMYDLGQIYSARLLSKDSAIVVYERLLTRFPETERAASVHYSLYTLKMPDAARAQPHKDWIMQHEPKSVYSMLIQGKDPLLAQQAVRDFRSAYEGLYDLYEHKQYASAAGFSAYILSNFQEEGAVNFSEVYFIRAMCYGYSGAKDSLRSILTRIVTNYPKADVTPKAKKILDGMSPAKPAASIASAQAAPATPGDAKPAGDPKDPANPAYEGFKQSFTAGDKLIVLFFLDVKGAGKNEIQVKLADFNNANFKGKDLKTFVFAYGATHWAPYVNVFTTKEDAKAYMDAFLASPLSKELMRNPADRVVFMTQDNFKIAYGKKRMPDYIMLFDNILNPK